MSSSPRRSEAPPGGEAGRACLVVVGCGLQPPRHASARTCSEITAADRVLVLADAYALSWVAGLNPVVVDLSRHYAPDQDRRESYRAMQDEILCAVREDLRVCAVFYGHPAVFAQVGRKTLAQARAEGFSARMEPGISAEACLYVDLDLDPGEYGVQSCEATQFLLRQQAVNPAALLLLWQVALTGNLACRGFEPDPARLQVLVDKLLRWYAPDTAAILYEAATLPVEAFRAEPIALAKLPEARLNAATTLVIPPASRPMPDEQTRRRLARLG